ncbi:acid phosphatase [Colwellia demingiae]|uniref:acid phosphatase n=1 Tax=Colwellia demingiae TaxID=89401 RepID=UPI001FE898A5|nr:phosphatase PAP2 family protein [Colwellia demingiae]
MKIKINKVCIVLSSFLLFGGCTSNQSQPLEPVAELIPGILIGYLPHDVIPDGIALLPTAPIAGNAEDKRLNTEVIANQEGFRWELATSDDNLEFPVAASMFSCAIDAKISKEETPQLYRLLRRSATDAGLSTYAAKKYYQKKRPFMINEAPTCVPAKEAHLRTSGSYPSGHAAIGWLWGQIFSEITPEYSDKALARGWAVGESRLFCNVHWQSDVEAGRTMGAAAFARLHANTEFTSAMAAAKLEIASVRAKGLKSSRDCNAETNALSLNADSEKL